MKTICCVALLLCLVSCISQGEEQGQRLPPLPDVRLTTILNQMELVADTSKQESAFVVRIFRVQELGECGPKHSNCPSQRLYVAISTIDLAADQAVFVLPPAFGWSFIKWVTLPDNDFESSVVVVELEKSEITEPGKISKSRVELLFSPYGDANIRRPAR